MTDYHEQLANEAERERDEWELWEAQQRIGQQRIEQGLCPKCASPNNDLTGNSEGGEHYDDRGGYMEYSTAEVRCGDCGCIWWEV